MNILTLTGPSCSGKTTLLNALVADHGFQSIVSHTTRPMRPGEVEGKDYHFISDDHFDNKLVELDFIESITFNGSSYGVSLAELEAVEKAGKKAVLIVEPNGLIQMLKFISNKKNIAIKSVYIGGNAFDLTTRYLKRLAGEDLSIEGVAERHAKRMHSMIKEITEWQPKEQPWAASVMGLNYALNIGEIPYSIKLNELGPDNFETVIKQIKELGFKND